MTGSVNELIQHAKQWLADGEISPHNVAFKLNKVLLSKLASARSPGYGKPVEAFKYLVQQTT